MRHSQPGKYTFYTSSSFRNKAWDFGDMNGDSAQNPVHVYTTPGIYDVSLAATNAEGVNMAAKAGYILADPPVLVANFSVNTPRRNSTLCRWFY